MITESEYKTLRAKYDLYHSERKRLYPTSNCITREMAELLPESPTHSEVSAIEVYEFVNNPPKMYFAYINRKDRFSYRGNLTTWTGENLGDVYFGRAYTSNFGDKRISIDVRAINGIKYYGTYFFSAGDYCRITAYKDFQDLVS